MVTHTLLFFLVLAILIDEFHCRPKPGEQHGEISENVEFHLPEIADKLQLKDIIHAVKCCHGHRKHHHSDTTDTTEKPGEAMFENKEYSAFESKEYQTGDDVGESNNSLLRVGGSGSFNENLSKSESSVNKKHGKHHHSDTTDTTDKRDEAKFENKESSSFENKESSSFENKESSSFQNKESSMFENKEEIKAGESSNSQLSIGGSGSFDENLSKSGSSTNKKHVKHHHSDATDTKEKPDGTKFENKEYFLFQNKEYQPGDEVGESKNSQLNAGGSGSFNENLSKSESSTNEKHGKHHHHHHAHTTEEHNEASFENKEYAISGNKEYQPGDEVGESNNSQMNVGGSGSFNENLSKSESSTNEKHGKHHHSDTTDTKEKPDGAKFENKEYFMFQNKEYQPGDEVDESKNSQLNVGGSGSFNENLSKSESSTNKKHRKHHHHHHADTTEMPDEATMLENKDSNYSQLSVGGSGSFNEHLSESENKKNKERKKHHHHAHTTEISDKATMLENNDSNYSQLSVGGSGSFNEHLSESESKKNNEHGKDHHHADTTEMPDEASVLENNDSNYSQLSVGGSGSFNEHLSESESKKDKKEGKYHATHTTGMPCTSSTLDNNEYHTKDGVDDTSNSPKIDDDSAFFRQELSLSGNIKLGASSSSDPVPNSSTSTDMSESKTTPLELNKSSDISSAQTSELSTSQLISTSKIQSDTTAQSDAITKLSTSNPE